MRSRDRSAGLRAGSVRCSLAHRPYCMPVQKRRDRDRRMRCVPLSSHSPLLLSSHCRCTCRRQGRHVRSQRGQLLRPMAASAGDGRVNGCGAGMVTCAGLLALRGARGWRRLATGARSSAASTTETASARSACASAAARSDQPRSTAPAVVRRGRLRRRDRALGGIRGRHLADGGFSFRNRSGHGLTITEDRLRYFDMRLRSVLKAIGRFFSKTIAIRN